MFILVVSAIMNWSVVGLVKEYIVLILGTCWAGLWLALWIAEKCGKAAETKEKKEETEMKRENKEEKETLIKTPEESTEGGNYGAEEEKVESKKVVEEKEKVKQQSIEERKVEKKKEMMPKNNNIGMEGMGGSKVGMESEAKGGDDDKVRVENEGQTKEKSYDEEEERALGGKVKRKGSDKEDPIPSKAISSSNSFNNADQMATPRPDDVILSIEEEAKAGSMESISSLDQSASDSRCSRIKASISGCFSCIGRIPSCISTCFTCEHRSLCW